MTLRRLIIGIAVWLPTTVFASASWSQSQPNRVRSSHDSYSYLTPLDFSYPTDYNEEIRKSLERLKSETERSAIGHILADLDKKSNREILGLKLAPDVCQEIACRAVSPDTARRYVEAYSGMRVADDAYQTALRNAAATERSTLIAAAAASVSLLSLLISVLSYRRTMRSTKSAMPA